MHEDRLLKLPEVCRIVGLAKPTIYARLAKATFPRPLDLGGNAVRWRASTIREWMDALPVRGPTTRANA
jgi:prophage regulatory protein